jgi:hypothetical protein
MLKWARKQDCPWDFRVCQYAKRGGRKARGVLRTSTRPTLNLPLLLHANV